METNVLSRLSLYDHFGYLLVGAIALLVGALDLWVFGNPALIPSLDAATAVVWLVVAYFAGHLIQSVANLIIKENKTTFSESEKEVLNQARAYFGMEKQSDNEVYLLCYMLGTANDVTGQVQAFNANYSLYRGWFVVFCVQSIVLLVIGMLRWPDGAIFGCLVASVFVAWLMNRRARRFYGYSRGKTLQTFILISKRGI